MKYNTPQCPTTNHGWNERIVLAFARGCGAEVVRPKRTTNKPAVNFDAGFPPMKRVATYGILRGTDLAMKASKEFWYIDHGYFDGRTNFFRVTRNGQVHSGEGDHDEDRIKRFNLNFKDWKTDGEHILIQPVSSPQCECWGMHGWLEDTVKEIRKHTDRKIVISKKPNKKHGAYEGDDFALKEGIETLPIQQAMDNAWVLVADHSNTMTEALVQGVPIICTNKNRKIGSFDKIESPTYERGWLKNLAYNQWSLNQMQSGQAWEELNLWG